MRWWWGGRLGLTEFPFKFGYLVGEFHALGFLIVFQFLEFGCEVVALIVEVCGGLLVFSAEVHLCVFRSVKAFA